MRNDRAQELLAAYRTDTAPASEKEDALFDAIVRRIVTTDDEELVAAVCGEDENFDDSEEAFEDALEYEDDVTEDEPSANTSPSERRRRSVLLPVALATAAIAAGLVLALSVRGELLSQKNEASPWQAPNVEEAELPWWRRIVPKRLLDDAEVEPAPAAETDAQDVEDAAVLGGTAPHVRPRSVGGEPQRASQGQASSSVPQGAAAIPAPAVPDPADGWGAPLYDPRPLGPEPTTKQAGGVGGAYPGGGGGSTKPSNKDDSGQPGDGDGDAGDGDGDSPRPSNPRPSPGGGGGGGGDDGDRPQPPPTPDPPDDPPPDDPVPDPHAHCMEILETCPDFGMWPGCEEEHIQCMCDVDLEMCMSTGQDPAGCHDQYEACSMFDMPPSPEECFDQYQGCALEVPPELCVEDLSACFQNYGGMWPEQCDEMVSTCEVIGVPLQCDDVAMACQSAIDPAMACEYEHMQCLDSAPPEEVEMCEGAYQDCMADLYGGPMPDEACWEEFDLCQIESPEDPMACEAVLDGCVSPW